MKMAKVRDVKAFLEQFDEDKDFVLQHNGEEIILNDICCEITECEKCVTLTPYGE